MKTKKHLSNLITVTLLALTFVMGIVPQEVLAQSTPLGFEQAENGTLRAPGQLMIKVKPGINVEKLSSPAAAPAALQPLFSRLGVRKVTSLGGGTGVLLLRFNGPVEQALQLAKADPAIARADANQLIKQAQTGTAMKTNDPLYMQGKQWWLDRVQAPKAWEITTGSKAIKVGVVDSGVDANHPDLRGKVVAAYNFAEETPVSRPGDEHGTAVAGCIGANTNNGLGISGLNWEVSLVDGKGFGESNSGFAFDLVRGVIFAIDQGARVVNNSWGGGGLDLATLAMAEYAAQKEAILVFSSGNSGFNEPQLPAALSQVYPNIIAVGATDINDKVVGFSTYGPQVSVVAPGSGIWTTAPDGSYTSINGTSFSAPIVTGVIALMLSVNPNLTPLDVRNIIEGTADDITGEGFTIKAGYGRVNAHKAVLAAKNNDVRPGKRSSISGKVTGLDANKVRLSLDPLNLTIKPAADGSFKVAGLGKGTYRIRAAAPGQLGDPGTQEFKLSGEEGSTRQFNFAFQSLPPNSTAPARWVDQARFFDVKAASLAAPGALYFGETGHSLSGTFLQYWQARGGLAIFGYPISEEFTEVSPTDGKLYTVQYFERNRFELHPENVGTPHEVLLGLLGSEGIRGRTFAPGQPTSDGLWFAETSQNLTGRFLEYWQARGGLALFGYPISPLVEENGRMVQYFERNRFELHPEKAPSGYDVLLGLLGTQMARQRGYI